MRWKTRWDSLFVPTSSMAARCAGESASMSSAARGASEGMSEEKRVMSPALAPLLFLFHILASIPLPARHAAE